MTRQSRQSKGWFEHVWTHLKTMFQTSKHKLPCSCTKRPTFNTAPQCALTSSIVGNSDIHKSEDGKASDSLRLTDSAHESVHDLSPQCNLESRPFYAIFPFSQSYWLHSFNMLQPIAVCRASEKDGVSLPRALLQINTGSSQTWQCFWSDCIGHANRHQSAQIQQDVRVLESSQRNVAPFQVLVTLTSRPPNHAGVPRIPPASQQHAAAVSVASESRWSCWTPSLQGQPNWVCLKMLCA